MDFDPIAVAKLNEKKIIAPGSAASSLLSEPKLRAIIENARQILKVGSLPIFFQINLGWSFLLMLVEPDCTAELNFVSVLYPV